jgi:glycosyltransferase involved in cell wall biosynthesis
MSERAFPSRVGFRGRINKILIPFLRSKLYSDADLITTVSLEVKEDLHRLVEIPDNRVLAIYNPSPSIKQDRCNVPHEWALSDRTIPLFLSAGRLNDQKDQATLIRAFAQIVRRRPSRLVILGEGEKRVELETLIDNLGISQHVLLPGFSTSALDWMRGTDVFVMSSVMEGMPNVLVEALSMGKKVVCTACVGGPREVLGYGRYGRLVPERDPDCLAVAMEQSLDMPDPERDTLALERFDPSVIFDAYENALVG